MLLILLTALHVIICLFLIVVVLLQSGKAADLAGAFGGMGSQTAFGPRGAATLLSKATTVAAVLFMVNSIALGILHSRQQGVGQSVIERTGGANQVTVPLTPVPATEAPATEAPATTPAPDASATPAAPESAAPSTPPADAATKKN
jgi:preprotein translocase subunit SecG